MILNKPHISRVIRATHSYSTHSTLSNSNSLWFDAYHKLNVKAYPTYPISEIYKIEEQLITIYIRGLHTQLHLRYLVYYMIVFLVISFFY